MPRVTVPLFALTAALAVMACTPSLRGQDTGLDLQQQVARLQAWLGQGPQADGWRRYLALNPLETLAAQPWQADARALDGILQRFDSHQPGLAHPIFRGVRDALAAHQQQLSAPPSDVAAALDSAGEHYVPATAERVEATRQRLLAEIELARAYYQSGRGGDPAAIAAELRLDDLRALVARLDLTAAPRAVPDEPAPADDAGETEPDAAGDGGDPAATSGGSAAGEPAPRGPSATGSSQADDLRELQTMLLACSAQAHRRSDRYFPLLKRQLEKVVLQYSQLIRADARTIFDRQVQTLRDLYPRLSDPAARQIQGDFATSLGWLDATGHAPQLVQEIRRQHMHANLRLYVTEAMAQRAAGRPVADGRPVSENILGRQIYGFANTNGQVLLDFVDDPLQGHVSIQLRGRVQTDGHTHEGPITAYTASHAEVEARRSVLFNAGGFNEYEPYAAAHLGSEFRGVNSIRLVERIAQQQYQRDRCSSEAIGAHRTEQRLIDQFRSETDAALADGRARWAQALEENRETIGRLPALCFRTTDDRLLGSGLKSDTFQISAPTEPPPSSFNPETDLVLQVHESLLSNYIEPVIARQTVQNTELPAKVEEWFGRRIEGLEANPDENWSITFASNRPVQFVFDNNLLGIAVVGSRFSRDGRPVNEPMVIQVLFRLERGAEQLRLVREGRATVEFVRPGVKTVAKNAFRSFLEDVLNKNLREQAEPAEGQGGGADLVLPRNLIPTEKLKDPALAERLELVLFRTEAGWLSAGWQLWPAPAPGHAAAVSAAMVSPDTPAIADRRSPPKPQ